MCLKDVNLILQQAIEEENTVEARRHFCQRLWDMCRNGDVVGHMNCPDGLLWNTDLLTCDWPRSVLYNLFSENNTSFFTFTFY